MTIYDESHKELREFIGWFNHFHKADPIIIGGWAVYYYNPYFESKDVDVVFDTPPYAKDQQLRVYFGNHGYELLPRDSFDINGRIGMTTGETFRRKFGVEFIDIDACSTTDHNKFVKNAYHDKEVPFSRAVKDSMKVTLPETTLTYRVPTIELLILYKLKAYNDRDELLKQAQSQEQITWPTSKRDKDGSDIIALFDKKNCRQTVNFDKLNQLIDELGVRQVVRETLSQTFNNTASIQSYKKLNVNQICDIYERTIIQKLLYSTKEEIANYLTIIMNDYREKIEEQPLPNQKLFPTNGYPIRATAAATRNNVYFFFTHEGTRNMQEVFTSNEVPGLEEVMDDLRDRITPNKIDHAAEVITLIGIQKPLFKFEVPNNASLMEKYRAEGWAKQLYEHFYNLVSETKHQKRLL